MPVPDKAIIPNMTSHDFFEKTRESRIDKLREIINETPTGNIEKMRQITEDLQEETSYDEDENEYKACTGLEDELCHCDMDEINCSDIVLWMDDPHLHTADLVIQIKDFKPIIANFSQNAISRLHKNKVLPGFEKYVSKLDFSYNHIRFMDSEVFKPFTNLSKLYLSHNNLQTFKKQVFEPVKDTLHRLDLGYNRIKSLDDGIFEGLTNLEVLSLDGNPIKTWKKEIFKGLDNLKTLSLDNCNIDDLPADIFEYLPKLTGISLRENPFEEIPSVVANLKSLKNVDMSITNLTEIRDHAFAGDSSLEEIILEKMPFLSVVRDCGFCGLPQLKIILLNDNKQLIEVHPNAFGFIKSEPGHKSAAITNFDIHGSNITTISEHMIDYDKLDTFKVGGNPWKCDCGIQFMMQEKFLFKSDSVAPKCASPPTLVDHHLATVRVTDACEDARFLGRSGRFSSVLGLALLAGFLAIGAYYMVSSGKLEKLVRQVRKEPEVSYTNLQAAGEDFALETDFQPRPAEV
uniref:LRRCT domain-containing protein n=2 Tax=Caenorhabditis tropicalis TaxID=1561998 RepID=A0A1I7TWJ6_9PELO